MEDPWIPNRRWDVRSPDQVQTSALYFAGPAYADRRHRWSWHARWQQCPSGGTIGRSPAVLAGSAEWLAPRHLASFPAPTGWPRHAFPSRIRIRSASNSAVMANTLNSNL